MELWCDQVCLLHYYYYHYILVQTIQEPEQNEIIVNLFDIMIFNIHVRVKPSVQFPIEHWTTENGE